MIPLISEKSKNVQEYLIFGGIDFNNQLIKRQMIFEENLADFRKSKLVKVQEKLAIKDRLYF